MNDYFCYHSYLYIFPKGTLIIVFISNKTCLHDILKDRLLPGGKKRTFL